MEGYKANIAFASKELTGKEKVMLKDLTNATSLDDATDGNAPLVVDLDYYALIHIHNERSENKEYDVCVIVDKAGTKYRTGSESFRTSLEEIVEDMADTGEEWSLSIYRMPSKNYKGKSFITCSVV